MNPARLHTADVLTFTITGPEAQRALTLAADHEIRLAHIRPLPQGYQARIAGVDWPRLQRLLQGSAWSLHLLQRRGPGPLLERLALRPGLPLGAAWVAICVFLLSRFLWTIDFGPLDAHEQYEMRQLLEQQSIHEGTLLTEDLLARAQAAALRKSEQFGWISLNFTGGRLFIESTEAEHQTIEVPPQKAALYAAVAGEITAIEAESGFCMVSVGQQVEAGELLVDMQRLDRKGNPVVQGASGQVIARVEKSYSAAQPYRVKEHYLTGRCTTTRSLQLLGREIFRQEPDNTYTGATAEDWLPLHVGRLTLPGVLHLTTTYQETTAPRQYSEEAAAALALRQCRAQLYVEFPDATIEAERRSSIAGDEAVEATITYIFCANIAQSH